MYTIFHIANIVFYIMLAVSFVMLIQKIIYHIVGLFPSKRFPEAKTNHKYAFLIPARNESKVIEALLLSIQNQDYDKNLIDTYVIVESESDPTCEIVKKYERTHIFVRQHLELKGKGYALNEAIQDIFSKNKDYEAFFICDADNVLTSTFVREMNKTYDSGYKIALGYRNSKNWNDGWVACCSALTFSMINTFHNKCRSKFNRNVVISGTGFYISADILKKLGGWIFCTLTEDYELSAFSALNNVKSTYNEYAEYYDEQPTKIKASWNQRLRWVKGFSQTNKKYKKKLIKSMLFDKENRWSKFEFTMSIIPVAFLLITMLGYSIFTLVLSVVAFLIGSTLALKILISSLIVFLVTYLFFVLYNLVMVLAERKHTNLKFNHALAAILMGPIYMALYIPIFFQSLFQKEVKWVPIEHKVNLNEKDNTIVETSLEESESAWKLENNTLLTTKPKDEEKNDHE